MPLNPASTESESQKLTLFGFNDMADHSGYRSLSGHDNEHTGRVVQSGSHSHLLCHCLVLHDLVVPLPSVSSNLTIRFLVIKFNDDCSTLTWTLTMTRKINGNESQNC